MSPDHTSISMNQLYNIPAQGSLACIICFLLSVPVSSICQSDSPIWGIGTKWTYEFKSDYYSTSYATDEIVDTTRINSKLLYVVHSEPEWHGIRYFYYEGSKVYNYNTSYDFNQLLYDFSSSGNYQTKYHPICDPEFDYENDTLKDYTIRLDSTSAFTMPDNTIRAIRYYSPLDTVFEMNDTFLIANHTRSVLDGIGFMQGGLHYTHDWENGDYICDEFGNYMMQLRCFENDSVSYNFVGYDCDSSWVISSASEIVKTPVRIFPNPTLNGRVQVTGIDLPFTYGVYTSTGVLVGSGTSADGVIRVDYTGLLLINISSGKDVVTRRILNVY